MILASLIFSSGLRAQYQWHIVLPDHVDTNYRAITSISCSGESCTALEVLYSTSIGDSNVVLHSTDGGLDWTAIGTIPQRIYDSSGITGLYFGALTQIDSLNAIAVSMNEGVILRTYDGWKTWTADSSLLEAYLNNTSGTLLNEPAVYDIDFANASDGMMNESFGFYLSTVDTGKHWKQLIFHSSTSYHSYGGGMFRVFSAPATIFTTHDNWETNDTTFISYNGPLVDTSFSPGEIIFGNGDTLAILGARWDKTDFSHSMAMALSTDLGAHWTELPLPRNNGIYYSNTSLSRINWDHIVIAGLDSVGRILQSIDRGASWELDTVRSSDGVPYYNISNTAVTGSGRVLASIIPDADYLGSSSLAYLEPVPSSVETWERTIYGTQLYPNPATDMCNIQSVEENLPVHIFDVLGREVLATKLSSTGAATLNVSALPRGIYVVRLEELGTMVTIGMLSLVE
jgi:photosystem II stability/assembly factor-like uncharacterized protein